MKLFWKLFLGMFTLTLASFTVFGVVLLQTTFHSSLEREKNNSLEEMEMFQYIFLTSMNSLAENSQVDHRNVARLVSSMESSIGDGQTTVAVYDENQNLIYKSAGHQKTELSQMIRQEEGAWRLTVYDGQHFWEAVFPSESEGQRFHLEYSRNIESVYRAREEMLAKYRWIMLALGGFSMALSALFSAGVTSPIKKLATAARVFAQGEYGQRVQVKGKDEIAMLERDFNLMAEQLEENIYQLEKSVQQQEEFTGAFAHELKTPLTSVIGYAEMLMSMELSEEERRDCADYIYREGKRLESLSHKMLELVRLDHIMMEMRTLNAETLGEELRRVILPGLEKKKIQFSLQLEPGEIEGDMDLLITLFLNLLDNARKACDENGTITLTGEETTEGYRFRLQDDGSGMEEEEVRKITEAFYMVDKSRARREGGVGLGLALCQRIVELHHARWKIESSLRKGTAVEILFLKKGK